MLYRPDQPAVREAVTQATEPIRRAGSDVTS